MRFAPLLLIAALLTSVVMPSKSALAQNVFIPPMPDDMEQVDMYLLTVGRSAEVSSVFGHTIIRVVDRSHRLDMNFNWGMFDFYDPSFIWKFYIGDLRYAMAITDFTSMIENYRTFEKRGVVQDKLNLTSKQKRVMMERFIWNSRPENIYYQYSQFYDNCATKPRDYLDEALGGKLKERLTRAPSPLTFRDHIRGSTNANWWVYMGLDQLTNDLQEAPILPWNEMFLPRQLREHLRNSPAFDDEGLPIPGQALLTETQVLVDLPEPQVGRNPYLVMLIMLGIPMSGALYVVFTSKREKLVARMLGAVSVIYGLWIAFWGTAFVMNWLVSRYPEVKHNAGLFMVWPLDWAFFGFGIWLLIKGRRPARCLGLRWLAIGHVISFVVLALGTTMDLIKQDTFGMMASTGVLGLLYFGAVIARGTTVEPA